MIFEKIIEIAKYYDWESIFRGSLNCDNNTEYGIFNELKQQYEIIEFQPKTFLNIKRLNNVGITKQDIINYVQDVYDFVDYGEFFTFKSLKLKEYDHELHMLGFDDCFYASLISENKELFSTVKIGGIPVMTKGH